MASDDEIVAALVEWREARQAILANPTGRVFPGASRPVSEGRDCVSPLRVTGAVAVTRSTIEDNLSGIWRKKALFLRIPQEHLRSIARGGGP